MAQMAIRANAPLRSLHYLGIADRAANLRKSPREQAVNQLARAEIMAFDGKSAQAHLLAQDAAGQFEAMHMPWFLGEAHKLLARF
jgi:hypothetical protein